MKSDDWEGLPPLGARVRVRHLTSTIEGEVVLHYRLFGTPVAQVRVEIPVSREPYETRFVTGSFDRDAMEIVSD